MDADAIVIGAGLAGLAATAELARAGRRVLLLDQESESNMGGQAFWSFGGLFLVGTPEQRRMGIRDSHELAWQDWLGSAFFDRGIDDPAGAGQPSGQDRTCGPGQMVCQGSRFMFRRSGIRCARCRLIARPTSTSLRSGPG
jgi:glycine/D-amino acid oxidase-like deaminating enzyme